MIKIGPTVQVISNFRLPKCGAGSGEPGWDRKESRAFPIMATTIPRMTPQTMRTTMKRCEILAVSGEKGWNTGMLPPFMLRAGKRVFAVDPAAQSCSILQLAFSIIHWSEPREPSGSRGDLRMGNDKGAKVCLPWGVYPILEETGNERRAIRLCILRQSQPRGSEPHSNPRPSGELICLWSSQPVESSPLAARIFSVRRPYCSVVLVSKNRP